MKLGLKKYLNLKITYENFCNGQYRLDDLDVVYGDHPIGKEN